MFYIDIFICPLIKYYIYLYKYLYFYSLNEYYMSIYDVPIYYIVMSARDKKQTKKNRKSLSSWSLQPSRVTNTTK